MVKKCYSKSRLMFLRLMIFFPCPYTTLQALYTSVSSLYNGFQTSLAILIL